MAGAELLKAIINAVSLLGLLQPAAAVQEGIIPLRLASPAKEFEHPDLHL
jgi:hypothetical protein